ncbi:uncharacterized protein LOC116243404 [Phasianus colchicus]|uniref:uncharacterized protein LOC116243404 n=1 Tax=Phasianus colchicus TaxID=9054 RepID=UPI00129EC2E4|nr:uncharacterized protein LOC116243404 [Phasianus colchicus]
MDQVIKVLLQFCKSYCGRTVPSKKEIAAVLSRLEKEGELDSPQQVLDSNRWDSLTSALCQRAMSDQKASELKTWGLILGALKAAKVEGKFGEDRSMTGVVRSGSLLSHRSGEAKMAATTENGGGEMQKEEPPSQSCEPTAPPPPYPAPSLCPSLDKMSQPEPPPEERDRVGGGAGRGSPRPGGGPVTDWAKVKEEAEEKGLANPATFPVVVSDEGPIWVPLDPKGITRVLEAVEKKGLKSPLTMNALENLTAQGPLLPYDIENLMRMVLKPVQYTLWKEEWQARLRQMLVTVQNDPANALHNSDLQRLMGSAPGLLTAQAQVTQLRPGELIATSDAALEAFRRLARNAEPSTPWTEIIQGPTESFQDFADRLIKAVEGSDLPRAVHGPVILDCLYQKSSGDIRALLRAAPERFHTPGEAIKYIVDKQKSNPSVVGEVAAAVAGVMMAHGGFGLPTRCRVGSNNIGRTCLKTMKKDFRDLRRKEEDNSPFCRMNMRIGVRFVAIETLEYGHEGIRTTATQKEAQFRCLYIRACSMGNKQKELEAIVWSESYDIVTIMETR